MVIVRITMGLGNQMFEYAAGLSLALEKKTTLKVDTSSYAGYKLRNYELEAFFGIDTDEATAEEIKQCRYNHPVIRVWNKIFPKNKIRVLGFPYDEKFIKRKLLAGFDFFYPPHKRKTYVEPTYHYDKNFFKASGNVYLHGFWMSWKYFEKYDAEIRKVFIVKRSLIKHLDTIVESIKNSNSVSIHIRRTDYTSPEVIKLKGLLTLDFFVRAIDYIKDKTGAISLYVFSDDITWVKENFTVSDTPVCYIDNTVSCSAVDDYYLMSQCKHNVISNSTFSWWAAYLNSNREKIIVSPRNWYVVPHINTRDVRPLSWVILD